MAIRCRVDVKECIQLPTALLEIRVAVRALVGILKSTGEAVESACGTIISGCCVGRGTVFIESRILGLFRLMELGIRCIGIVAAVNLRLVSLVCGLRFF